MQGRFSQGEFTIGRVTKKFSVHTAGPINIRGEIVGALVLVADYPHVVDYGTSPLEAQTGTRAVHTTILDAGGTFVSHVSKFLQERKGAYADVYAQLARSGKDGARVEYMLDSVSYLGFAQVDPVSKWVVVTSGRYIDVFATARRSAMMVLVVCLAFLICIGLLFFFFTNGVLGTLLELIGYAKDVAAGDFSHRLGENTRKDELGTLQVALQRQVDTLQDMLVKTQEASRVKSRFLANMSHEIRTPLNAVLGMTHLTLRMDSLDAKARDHVGKIRSSAQFLLGLINDILDFSKIEAGMLVLEEVPFNLRDTMQNLVAMHRETAAAKHLYVRLDYPESLPAHFWGDPLRIGQVVNNLVTNAIKFTAAGGVDIRLEQVPTPDADATPDTTAGSTPVASPDTASPDTARCCIRVSVTDTGIGIAPETLKTLFQPFVQADASISRRFGGTGLGLVISKQLVALFGGEIGVDSTPGVGTTFHFALRLKPAPVVEEQAMGDVDEALAQLPLTGKRILVAEDNAINQIIMQEFLSPTGATVVMVDDGQQAVDAVRTQKFDLVFMDMQMPVMDGLEATRHIRDFADKAALPIIAVTANAMKEDKDQGLTIGMNDYITKPIEPAQVLNALRSWLVERKTAQ